MQYATPPQPPRKRGYSLAEVVITMLILALFVLAFTRGLTYAKYTAEDNLYDSTALNVAVSTIEQMKGAGLSAIENPPTVGGKDVFQMVVDAGNIRNLVLNEVNIIDVPLVTDASGNVGKSFEIKMTPTIEQMSSYNGYWLTVEYSYEHPRSKRVRSNIIRNARSTVR